MTYVYVIFKQLKLIRKISPCKVNVPITTALWLVLPIWNRACKHQPPPNSQPLTSGTATMFHSNIPMHTHSHSLSLSLVLLFWPNKGPVCLLSTPGPFSSHRGGIDECVFVFSRGALLVRLARSLTHFLTHLLTHSLAQCTFITALGTSQFK